MTGVAGSRGDEEPVDCARSPESGRQIVCDAISEGGTFCPLSFIPLAGSEPFTVVAREDCVLFCAVQEDLLNLSEQQLHVLRQSALSSLYRRLRRLGKSFTFSNSNPNMTF